MKLALTTIKFKLKLLLQVENKSHDLDQTDEH